MTETTAQRRDRLVELAIAAAGSDDFGADSWREGLELLLEDLAGPAELNEIGVGVAEDGVVGDLATRLRIEAWRKEHPEVADQEIRRPVIIVGQPRTGTTILLDLMAQDPDNRAPLSWEEAVLSRQPPGEASRSAPGCPSHRDRISPQGVTSWNQYVS